MSVPDLLYAFNDGDEALEFRRGDGEEEDVVVLIGEE